MIFFLIFIFRLELTFAVILYKFQVYSRVGRRLYNLLNDPPISLVPTWHCTRLLRCYRLFPQCRTAPPRDCFAATHLCFSGPSLLRFPLQTSFDCFCLCKNLRVSSILNGTIIHKLWGEMVTSQLGLLRCEYRTALRYSSLFHFMFN